MKGGFEIKEDQLEGYRIVQARDVWTGSVIEEKEKEQKQGQI